MESRFGRDFSEVRIHSDDQASQLADSFEANAFTTGRDIYFAKGKYAPHTTDGELLLAHELTHTIQQREVTPSRASIASSANDVIVDGPNDPLEHEADEAAKDIVSPLESSAVQLSRVEKNHGSAARVQRQPSGNDATKEFVNQWFRDHLVVSNKEIQSIAALPEPQREAVMNELRRRYGNEYIRRGMAGTLPEKEAADKEVESINVEEYWTKYGQMTMDAALRRLMTDVEFDIKGPGLHFSPNERGPFIWYGFSWRMNDTIPAHVSQLLDAPLFDLVNNVRILNDLDRAPDAYEPAVVERIIERLGLGVRRAADSLAIPYAKARYRAIADAELARHGMGPVSFAKEPVSDESVKAQPSSQSFGARTTIEHAVAESMCAGYVEFDKAALEMFWDTTLPGEPRPVELEFERGFGAWMMVHVIKPSNATAADVANALYGNPQFAHLVVGSGDHYSFVFPPNKQLAEPYETMWTNRLIIDEDASPLQMLWYRNATDPVLGLDDEVADQRALDAAAGYAVDAQGAAPVIQRLEIVQSVIDGIVAAAIPLGVGPMVQPTQARITARRQKCATDPGEAERWAAQSAAQLDLLSEAKLGFDAITQQMFALGLPAQSTAVGEELVGDVTASMQGPTREVAEAYAAVVAASDQLDIGSERLTIAKERMASYPFDMVDRMLAMIRGRIATTSNYPTIYLHSYERARLDALQHEISATVAELRMAVVNGDATAAVKLQNLRSQLAMLDLQSQLGAMISAIDQLKSQLFRSESLDPEKGTQANIYDRLKAAIEPWRQLAEQYEEVWKAGHEQDPEWIALIRKNVGDLRKTTKLPELIDEVAQFAKDEAERQRWIAIGLIVFAALLSAATGGLASGAIGGVTGVIVGAGIEALTFTAITSTLNQDQTFGGFMAELGLNFVTFGGLRAISGGAKLLAGSRALTVGEKLGVMTLEGLWMTASAKAQEKIQEILNEGGKVSTQSATQIFGHQMIMVFASRIVGRGIGKLIEGNKEIQRLKEVETALALRGDVDKLAQNLLKSGDDKLGEALVKADTEALRAEATALNRVHEIAVNPAEAAKHGIKLDADALGKIKAAAEGAAREVTEREIAELMQQTEVHANHAIAEPAVYGELLQKHRKQGSTIVESLDSAGQPKATITPLLADQSFGAPFTLHSRLGDEVEKILSDKNLPNTAVVGDYLAKRATDRAGALADLRKVTSVAEFDALMEKTLGKDAVAARRQQLATAQEPAISSTSSTTSQPEKPLKTEFTKEEWSRLTTEERRAIEARWLKERGGAAPSATPGRPRARSFANAPVVNEGTGYAWYEIRGDRAIFARTRQGYHVYEYLDENFELLYVGKSGSIQPKGKRAQIVDIGVPETEPNNWINRLQKDHIHTEWIGQAKYVRVTYHLTDQEMWALEEVLIPTARYNIKQGDFTRMSPQGSLSENARSAVKGSTVLFGFEAYPVQ